MSLNQAIDDNETGTYTVTRAASGTWVRGRYVRESPSTFPVSGSLQAQDGLTIHDSPAGQYALELKLFLTETELRTRSTTNDPDFMTDGVDTWRIEQVGKVQHWGETHYEVIVSKFNLP